MHAYFLATIPPQKNICSLEYLVRLHCGFSDLDQSPHHNVELYQSGGGGSAMFSPTFKPRIFYSSRREQSRSNSSLNHISSKKSPPPLVEPDNSSMGAFHGCGRAPVKISPLAPGAVPTSGEVGSFKVDVYSRPYLPRDGQTQQIYDAVRNYSSMLASTPGWYKKIRMVTVCDNPLA